MESVEEDMTYGCTPQHLNQFENGVQLKEFLNSIPQHKKTAGSDSTGKAKFTRGYVLNRLYKAMKRRDLMPTKFDEINAYGAMTIRAKEIFNSEIDKLSKVADEAAWRECIDAICFIDQQKYIRAGKRKFRDDFAEFEEDSDDEGFLKKGTYKSKKKKRLLKASKGKRGPKEGKSSFGRLKKELFVRLREAEADALAKQSLAAEAEACIHKMDEQVVSLRDAIGHQSFGTLPREAKGAITSKYTNLLLNPFDPRVQAENLSIL